MTIKHTVQTSFFFMSLMMVSIFSQPATAQTASNIFNQSGTPVFYLGIDFTKARLIDDANASETDIRDRQYAGINDVIVSEPKKYNLNSAFRKTSIDHDLGLVAKRNEKVDAAQIKSTNTADFPRLKEDDITALVKGFDFADKKGVGLLFIMEAMSKSAKAAAVWVTLADMKTKKVLITERIESKVSMGFGFRNFWASSIRNLIKTIEDKKYNEWQNKYQ